MNERETTWKRLDAAATDYAAKRDKPTAQELSRAAIAWPGVEATQPQNQPRTTSGERGAVTGDGWTFRFGRQSGKRPGDVDVRDLRWYERVFRESLDSPEKQKYRENNQRSLDVVRAELRRRGEAANED